MPDTGASQSIVSAAIARDANLCVRPTLTELRNASNGVMTLLGEADTVLCNDRHSVRTVVLVASDLNYTALIGWQDLQRLLLYFHLGPTPLLSFLHIMLSSFSHACFLAIRIYNKLVLI